MRFRPAARVLLLASTTLAACRPLDGCGNDSCGTVVFAAVGEPDNLLPPVTDNVLSRDIHDQLFLKLADIGPGLNTIGDSGFVPQLAERWRWDDSLTLVFQLNREARWHDGPPVTAHDVEFSFEAYRDPAVNSPHGSSLARIAAVTARDSSTVAVRFRQRYPEMFYTAVYYVRVLPSHLLGLVPRADWATAPFGRQPVGNGPYRFVSWTPAVSIELRADSNFFLGRPKIPRLLWRIEPDHPTAVNRVIAGEADALQVLVTPDNVARARETPRLTLHTYPGTNYGFLGFNQTAGGDARRPHPLFGDRDVRRALAMALDRARMAQSVFGDLAKVPPGPVPAAWPLWEPRPRELAYDTAAAARLLEERGWRDANGDGVREKGGARLAFRIMVPTTSAVRRQYARLVQEQLRGIGAQVELDELEGPVFGQRAGTGRFDALIGIWDVEPSFAAINDLWTRQGIGGPNWVRYSNPDFEQLVARAAAGSGSPGEVRTLWRQALELFNDDAPAVMLFATSNVAAVDGRIEDVVIRPDSYWALVRGWRIPVDQLNARDRAAPAN